VQGSTNRLGQKLAVTVTVALAFFASAVLVFALATSIGELVGAGAAPASWRYLAAAGLLCLLAAIDVLSLRRARYCLVGLIRQTPRSVMFRYNFLVAAAVWGFDTGLAVTTIRVAGLTWAALLLAMFGLAPWWTGLAYAAGFAIPLVGLICLHPAGRAAVASGPVDPGLGRLLNLREPIQVASVVLLTAVALCLAAQSLLGDGMARL
jgi:hypothetical protein